MNVKIFLRCLFSNDVEAYVKTHCWALVFSVTALIISIISLILSL